MKENASFQPKARSNTQRCQRSVVGSLAPHGVTGAQRGQLRPSDVAIPVGVSAPERALEHADIARLGR